MSDYNFITSIYIWISNIDYVGIASILGFFLSLYVAKNVYDVNRYIFIVKRLPQYLKSFVAYASNISELLSNFEKNKEQIEDEISNHLSEIGLNKDGFTDKLHFEIPEYSFAKKAVESTTAHDLDHWKHFRNMANQASSFLLGYLQIDGEIRIWPHHFDTGIYVVSEKGMGIGFGLAMEDTLIGAPYFYMSGYPAQGSIEFNNLPKFSTGKWETSPTWQGAVLPLDELINISEKLQIEAVNSYMVKAVNWYLS